MKFLLLIACCLITLVGVHGFIVRNPRDVSQLNIESGASIYLPPDAVETQTEDANNVDDSEMAVTDTSSNAAEVKETPTIEMENDNDATILKPEGYVYKTVRRLRVRTRRDVSHLNNEYLPPPPSSAAIRTPAIHYLPPVESVRKAPVLSNEYLPPIELAIEATTTTEAPIITTLPPATTTTTTTEEIVTDLPTTELPDVHPKELVDDTAVLTDDGYHYKKPDVVPDLSPVREYLPPLDDSVVVDEISSNNDETATLSDDGYRYRAVRRFRF